MLRNLTENDISQLLPGLELSRPRAEIRKAVFSPLQGHPQAELMSLKISLGYLGEVPMDVVVELGRNVMRIREILDLEVGKVVIMDKLAGEMADVYLNGEPLARGEILVINDVFAVRIHDLISTPVQNQAETGGEGE